MVPEGTPRQGSSPDRGEPEDLAGHSGGEQTPGDVTRILSAVEQGIHLS